MTEIAKRQHVVPRFYLSQWCDESTGHLHLYDLKEKKHVTPSPADALVIKNFYEVDPVLPPDYAEKVLALAEDEVAPILKALHAEVVLGTPTHSEVRIAGKVRAILGPEQQRMIKHFAAYQYLRVPGAIDQKRYELEPAGLSAIDLENQLKPGTFVLAGFEHLRERFARGLALLIYFSFVHDFLTSDWPCFDFNDSQYVPILGEAIGVSKEVACMLPLTPRIW